MDRGGGDMEVRERIGKGGGERDRDGGERIGSEGRG